jgi:polyvinyl alcohol dehydrogenase (cytochrome)
MRLRSWAFVSLASLTFLSPVAAAADEGPTLYKQLCASCHEAGSERAPNRDALRAMTPERVLTALEAGPMLSMAAGRTGVERRAIAEFVTGKTFAQPLPTTPPPQTMCKTGGEFNPLAGPRWNAWGVNTSNTRYQDAAMAGLAAADVPRLRVKWAFGFPGELSVDSQPTLAAVCSPARRAALCTRSTRRADVHWMFQAAAAVRAQ